LYTILCGRPPAWAIADCLCWHLRAVMSIAADLCRGSLLLWGCSYSKG